ncbi:ribosomal protein L1/ribosomal biogenesis protein [Spinellus fusiger]|nr:ribosomal protein L1/ribosomal biogenesis protein [Spinellus fusiger]
MTLPVSKEQIEKAVSALYTAYDNTPANIASLWLIVTTKKMAQGSSLKPRRLPLQHSILPTTASVCLITKDPPEDTLAWIKDTSITCIQKVVSVKCLCSTYKSFESRRKLASSFTVFLVDDRITDIMPKLLGTSFFKKNKVPLPIKLSRGALVPSVERALGSTFTRLSGGVTHAAKIGHLGMSQPNVIENIIMALPAFIDLIPRQWKNIQMVVLKTDKSPALSLYCAGVSEPSPSNKV